MNTRLRVAGGAIASIVALISLFAALRWGTPATAHAAELNTNDSQTSGAITTTQPVSNTAIDMFANAPVDLPLPRLPQATTRRARLVQIQPEARLALETAPLDQGLMLHLNLFPETSFTAKFDQAVRNASGSVSWLGQLIDDPLSQVVVTMRDGMLYGTLYSTVGAFEISQRAGDVYLIREIDQAGFAENPADIGSDAKINPSLASPHPELPQTDDGSVFDVIVAYTDNARAGAGSTQAIEAQIETAVNNANLSYQNSGVASRARLAAMFEVAYVETVSSSLDLDNVLQGQAGLQIVHDLRDAYAADIVTLITEQIEPTTCGIGSQMETVANSFAPRAYNVVARSCMNTNLSLPHEWGHNSGARHDWYVDKGNRISPYSYAHGYVLTPTLPAPWRTIMAYDDQCKAAGTSCTRIARWSNPAMISGTYRLGVPAGTSTSCTAGNMSNPQCDADDHLTLNNTALTVANFRPGNLLNVYVNTTCTLVNGTCQEDGTGGFPFDTVTEGVYRAAPNTTVWLKPGTYPETLVLVNKTPGSLVINRPMILNVNGAGSATIGQ
jgi:hypothetical protein